jgi:hypothetical protein
VGDKLIGIGSVIFHSCGTKKQKQVPRCAQDDNLQSFNLKFSNEMNLGAPALKGEEPDRLLLA